MNVCISIPKSQLQMSIPLYKRDTSVLFFKKFDKKKPIRVNLHNCRAHFLKKFCE